MQPAARQNGLASSAVGNQGLHRTASTFTIPAAHEHSIILAFSTLLVSDCLMLRGISRLSQWIAETADASLLPSKIDADRFTIVRPLQDLCAAGFAHTTQRALQSFARSETAIYVPSHQSCSARCVFPTEKPELRVMFSRFRSFAARLLHAICKRQSLMTTVQERYCTSLAHAHPSCCRETLLHDWQEKANSFDSPCTCQAFRRAMTQICILQA